MDINAILDRLNVIESKLDHLNSERTPQEAYSTADFAALVGRRPYTVREWCRYGRIHAIKHEGVGRGEHEEWRISHAELERYRAHGLIPLTPRLMLTTAAS